MGPLKPGLPSEQPQPSSQAQRACLSCAQDPEEEEETTLAPSPLPSYAPGNEVRGPWEWLSQTEETGELQLHLSLHLAWRISGTGKSGGLPSMGSHRVGHD